jgi:RNA polymerase sigma factor (sigma-70 family)
MLSRRRAGADVSDGAFVVRTAFEILVQRHERMIRFKVQRITGNREDSEDVWQQTFYNILVHLRNFEGRSSFSTWLMRIALKEALMLKRSSWRPCAVSIDESDTEYSVAPLQIADARSNRPERRVCKGEGTGARSFSERGEIAGQSCPKIASWKAETSGRQGRGRRARGIDRGLRRSWVVRDSALEQATLRLDARLRIQLAQRERTV